MSFIEYFNNINNYVIFKIEILFTMKVIFFRSQAISNGFSFSIIIQSHINCYDETLLLFNSFIPTLSMIVLLRRTTTLVQNKKLVLLDDSSLESITNPSYKNSMFLITLGALINQQLKNPINICTCKHINESATVQKTVGKHYLTRRKKIPISIYLIQLKNPTTRTLEKQISLNQKLEM